jgi:hypothetical protein
VEDEMEYHVEGSMIGVRTFLSAFFYVWDAENADNGECGIFHNPDELYVYKTDKVDMITKRDINLEVGDILVMREFGNSSSKELWYRESRDSTVFYIADDKVLSIGRVNRRDEGTIIQHRETYQRSTWDDDIYPNKGVVGYEKGWVSDVDSGDDSYESSNDVSGVDSDSDDN